MKKTPKKKKGVPDKIKKFVKEHIQQYAWEMDVSEYQGDILYMEDDEDVGEFEKWAGASTDRRYLRVTFKFYPFFLRAFEKGEIEACKKIIAHEVAHVATQHVMDLMTSCYKDEGETKDAWEGLTERIGRMGYKLSDLQTKKAK